MPPAQEEGCPTAHRIFVTLVGGGAFQRASICHAGQSELMHIEPINGVGELSLRDLTSVDVLLAWNEHDIIEELKSQLAIVARWCPIVAISEGASVPQVVRAMKAGAIDFLTKPVRREALFAAINAAIERARANGARELSLRGLNDGHASLTPRERQVLALVAQGWPNRAIAAELGVAVRTVKAHRAQVMHKMHLSCVADLVHAATRLGLIRRA